MRRAVHEQDDDDAAGGAGAGAGGAARSSASSSVPARLSSAPSSALSYSSTTTKLQKKQQPTLRPEPKKKRRFFGLGGSSSASPADDPPSQPSQPDSSSASRFFGRSLSTRSRPRSLQGGFNSASSPSPTAVKDSWLSSSTARPEPIAEEAPVARAHPRNRSNPAFRHSIAVAIPPSGADDDDPYQLRHVLDQISPDGAYFPSPLTSHDYDVGSSSAPLHERSVSPSPSLFGAVLNTSANTQSSDADEFGSKPSSSWSDRGKAPASSQYPLYNTHFLNPGDSRPSSSQSIEQPASPVDRSHYIAYHPRNAASQSSVNKVDVSRDPSPLPQPLQDRRGQPGQSGDYLNVHDPKKAQSKQLQMVQNNGDQRGATPPPSKSKEDLASLDFPQLLGKHEELNDKYRKVKKYYFEKDAQVQQLQNTLAVQRLAQSRTALDDNEYSNRFQRLDGAINNLAFNVRKDWKAVPPWLSPFVNNDATQKVTKEMTAVGRACISRWLVDEIFDRVFHPGLEPTLSASLKIIERNLRRYSPPVNTDEERDALLTKISNWRLATLDGLSEVINSQTAADYRTDLTRNLVETLTSDLQMNLTTPPPAGLEAGVVGIIELAVGIAANLPLESRDVYVEYILPGISYNEAYMKLEGTLPPLVNPGESYVTEPEQQHQMLQQGRRGSADEPMADDSSAAGGPPMGGFVGAGPKDKKGNGGKKGEEERKEIEKVRFAAFMSVMVKGKSMLVKAPVFV